MKVTSVWASLLAWIEVYLRECVSYNLRIVKRRINGVAHERPISRVGGLAAQNLPPADKFAASRPIDTRFAILRYRGDARTTPEALRA